jgi:hypothetical protein
VTPAETAISTYAKLLNFDQLRATWPSTEPLDELGVHPGAQTLAAVAAVIVLAESVLAGKMGLDRADSFIDAPWMWDNFPGDDEEVGQLLDYVEELREIISFSGPDARPSGDVGWWDPRDVTFTRLREVVVRLAAEWNRVVNGRASQ